MRDALLPLLLLTAALSTGCTALATSPSWTGGGLVTSAPLREAEEDAKAARERDREAREPKEIAAKHILVMHVDSTSRPAQIKRTRDEARARAQECLLKLRGGADFDEMVREYSDEPGGAERAGDLGIFERGQMVKGFSDTAFGLKINEVSEVVETQFGFHIIKRTE